MSVLTSNHKRPSDYLYIGCDGPKCDNVQTNNTASYWYRNGKAPSDNDFCTEQCFMDYHDRAELPF